jgi:leucyl/phenylalanyl-tRNA--protein transferase
MALLDPDMLLKAYSIGVFPMADSREAEEVYWVEPKKRAIIPLDGFHMSKSLRKTIRNDMFEMKRDTAFREVVRRCAGREETWINDEIEESYTILHKQGHAHSVECWQEGELVGGLYGVKLGGAFFGESMFSARTDASKVALAWLVARLIVGGFKLLDCQFMTEHLRSLGAVEVRQKDYLKVLETALPAGLAAALVGDALGAAVPPPADESPFEFGALDRLLAEAGGSPPGRVIAQLLGHTS